MNPIEADPKHGIIEDAAPVTILMVEDDRMYRENIRVMLGKRYVIDEAETGEDGWERLNRGTYAAVLLDLHLGSGMDGFAFLEKMRRENLQTPVVIASKTGSTDKIVRAIKMGASNYIYKGAGGVDIELILDKAIADSRLARDNLAYRSQIDAMIGKLSADSATGKALLPEIERIAAWDATVVITGETGVGKEVVAREIHRRSGRRDRALHVLDCTTLKGEVAESELFGHERGAFTGAITTHTGIFEAADGATVFMDEIGELPLDLQKKLLRVLESGTLRRVGRAKELSVDVRVIAATNRDLRREVGAGRFREDLLHRIEVLRLRVPPLRERVPDIVALARAFLDELNSRRKSGLRFDDEALMALSAYSWPGNVRELRNVVERCFVYAHGSAIDSHSVHRALPLDQRNLPRYKEAKRRLLVAFQRDYIQTALAVTGGNITRTAELMELSRPGLRKAMESVGLSRGVVTPRIDVEQSSAGGTARREGV